MNLRHFFPEYLKAGDYNVVAVDWSLLSSWDNYPVAAGNAIEVGKHVGKLFSELIREKGLDPKKIHIVGHSLGSHVAAHIGRQIQESGLGKVGRISALDPAKPWFDGSNRPQRIGKNDADFVDVIHTNSGSIVDVRNFLDQTLSNLLRQSLLRIWTSLTWLNFLTVVRF